MVEIGDEIDTWGLKRGSFVGSALAAVSEERKFAVVLAWGMCSAHITAYLSMGRMSATVLRVGQIDDQELSK